MAAGIEATNEGAEAFPNEKPGLGPGDLSVGGAGAGALNWKEGAAPSALPKEELVAVAVVVLDAGADGAGAGAPNAKDGSGASEEEARALPNENPVPGRDVAEEFSPNEKPVELVVATVGAGAGVPSNENAGGSPLVEFPAANWVESAVSDANENDGGLEPLLAVVFVISVSVAVLGVPKAIVVVLEGSFDEEGVGALLN